MIEDCTSICDIVESIALEEEAIAAILFAESKKIEKILEISEDAEEILAVNESVGKMIKNITMLELILKNKLKLVSK